MSTSSMPRPVEIARQLSSLLFTHGFYQSSDGTRMPEKIDSKHPIYLAILAYRETFPRGRFPVRLSQHVRKLLRYSHQNDTAAFDMAELIIEDLQDMNGAIQELPLEDGPFAPDGLRYHGLEILMSSTVWNLLNILWPENIVKESTVNEQVWGDDNDFDNRRLRTTLNRVNLILRKSGVPWLYRRKNGYVVRAERNHKTISPL